MLRLSELQQRQKEKTTVIVTVQWEKETRSKEQEKGHQYGKGKTTSVAATTRKAKPKEQAIVVANQNWVCGPACTLICSKVNSGNKMWGAQQISSIRNVEKSCSWRHLSRNQARVLLATDRQKTHTTWTKTTPWHESFELESMSASTPHWIDIFQSPVLKPCSFSGSNPRHACWAFAYLHITRI